MYQNKTETKNWKTADVIYLVKNQFSQKGFWKVFKELTIHTYKENKFVY